MQDVGCLTHNYLVASYCCLLRQRLMEMHVGKVNVASYTVSEWQTLAVVNKMQC